MLCIILQLLYSLTGYLELPKPNKSILYKLLKAIINTLDIKSEVRNKKKYSKFNKSVNNYKYTNPIILNWIVVTLTYFIQVKDASDRIRRNKKFEVHLLLIRFFNILLQHGKKRKEDSSSSTQVCFCCTLK